MTRLEVILFLALLVIVSSRYGFAAGAPENDGGTLADIINSSMSQTSAFDEDHLDYDIMAQFMRDADLIQILRNDAQSGMTLFLPNDLGAMTTAGDIAMALGRSIPTTERQSYSTIRNFFKSFKNPDQALSFVLKFHMLPTAKTFDEIENDVSFETINGQSINRIGVTLMPTEGQDGIVETFPLPGFVFGPALTTEASNGYLHLVDRVLFPRMSQFESSDNDVDTNTQITPTPQGSGNPTSVTTPTPSAQPPVSPVPSRSSRPDSEFPNSPLPGANFESPAPQRESNSESACFPRSAVVHLQDGSNISISQLSAGHVIHSSEIESSMVYLFTHRTHEGIFDFVNIATDANYEIRMTSGHYIYANSALKPAGNVVVGDTVRTLDGEAKVSSVRVVQDFGLFAPHTLHGDIVVNRIVTSTYTTAVPPAIAHMMLWPLRVMTRLGITQEPMGRLLYEGKLKASHLIP